ncbi:hypothetical protein DID88_002262 [Monilinia fructigena]|uniref:Mitochondrial carrier protein n=1 Tax=Monilinia fructigena TaxID=38457 RepID=A0A395ID36_9HELO|nr:hypothetical protein DID88_002262 [Monilinia fructigena]
MATRESAAMSTLQIGGDTGRGEKVVEKKREAKNYRGFVAGVFSGVSKLTVGHPFDTIKVRLQTSTFIPIQWTSTMSPPYHS